MDVVTLKETCYNLFKTVPENLSIISVQIQRVIFPQSGRPLRREAPRHQGDISRGLFHSGAETKRKAETVMAEEKKASELLLEEPYRSVLFQDYSRTLTVHRNRRRMENIENELSWFTNRKDGYRTWDERGYIQKFQEEYGRDGGRLAQSYRPLTQYPQGREPGILYFILLYVKKYAEFQAYAAAHPIQERSSDPAKALEYRRLRAEFHLIQGLIARLENVAKLVASSIDEATTTDYLKGAENLSLPLLENRFMRAVSNGALDACEKLLEYMKKAGADTSYEESMIALREKNYEKASELAGHVGKEKPQYSAAQSVLLESAAQRGDIDGFMEAFETVGQNHPDSMYFIYLLQTLVCNADYNRLDSDEFEQDVQKLLKTDFNKNPNPVFTGLVSRKFVEILLAGLPICEDILKTQQQFGKDALIPDDRLNSLYRYQMALQLYPQQDVQNLIDLDYMAEHGADYCRKKIGAQAAAILLERNPDHSFNNVALAFSALEQTDMMDAYVKNVESNLENLRKYAERGEKRAALLIQKAADYKKKNGADAAELEKVLEELGA